MNVTLLRHGQAQVKGEDYDHLSDLGFEQAALVGAHLLRTMPRPQCVCVGPRRRHRQTWEASALAGDGWPEPSYHQSLDELPAEPIMQLGLPVLAQTAHPAASLLPKLQQSGGLASLEVSEIIRLFDVVLALWMDGVVTDPELESWPRFLHRVKQTLEGLAAHARDGKPVLAITSAGFISAARGLILGLEPSDVRRQMWTVPNCSLTVLSRGSTVADWDVKVATSDTFLPIERRSCI